MSSKEYIEQAIKGSYLSIPIKNLTGKQIASHVVNKLRKSYTQFRLVVGPEIHTAYKRFIEYDPHNKAYFDVTFSKFQNIENIYVKPYVPQEKVKEKDFGIFIGWGYTDSCSTCYPGLGVDYAGEPVKSTYNKDHWEYANKTGAWGHHFAGGLNGYWTKEADKYQSLNRLSWSAEKVFRNGTTLIDGSAPDYLYCATRIEGKLVVIKHDGIFVIADDDTGPYTLTEDHKISELPSELPSPTTIGTLKWCLPSPNGLKIAGYNPTASSIWDLYVFTFEYSESTGDITVTYTTEEIGGEDEIETPTLSGGGGGGVPATGSSSYSRTPTKISWYWDLGSTLQYIYFSEERTVSHSSVWDKTGDQYAGNDHWYFIINKSSSFVQRYTYGTETIEIYNDQSSYQLNNEYIQSAVDYGDYWWTSVSHSSDYRITASHSNSISGSSNTTSRTIDYINPSKGAIYYTEINLQGSHSGASGYSTVYHRRRPNDTNTYSLNDGSSSGSNLEDGEPVTQTTSGTTSGYRKVYIKADTVVLDESRSNTSLVPLSHILTPYDSDYLTAKSYFDTHDSFSTDPITHTCQAFAIWPTSYHLIDHNLHFISTQVDWAPPYGTVTETDYINYLSKESDFEAKIFGSDTGPYWDNMGVL